MSHETALTTNACATVLQNLNEAIKKTDERMTWECPASSWQCSFTWVTKISHSHKELWLWVIKLTVLQPRCGLQWLFPVVKPEVTVVLMLVFRQYKPRGAVSEGFEDWDRDFYIVGISLLLMKLRKCVRLKGDYWETVKTFLVSHLGTPWLDRLYTEHCLYLTFFFLDKWKHLDFVLMLLRVCYTYWLGNLM